MALIAVTQDKGQEAALAVARYAINPDGTSCNFALAVADSIAGKGLGGKLMVSLMAAAREQGLKEMEGNVLNNNHRMLKFMSDLGFAIQPDKEDHGLMKVSKLL
jgi:acetyltransferase